MSSLDSFEGVCEALGLPANFEKILAIEGADALIDRQVNMPIDICSIPTIVQFQLSVLAKVESIVGETFPAWSILAGLDIWSTFRRIILHS